MAQPRTHLEDFPELETWFQTAKQNPPQDTDLISQLVWSTCKALSQESPQRLNTWMQALHNFFSSTSQANQDFIAAEKHLASGGLSFMTLASEVAEIAIHMDKGKSYFELMNKVADQTGLAVFRFLAAWTALNSGDLDTCIAECDRIDQPFACVYTIQGQALLEKGMVDEAIESLYAAVELDPSEIIALFQLAKALHLKQDFVAAWEALEHCQKIAPGHPEIATMMAFIALDNPEQSSYLNKAWQEMQRAVPTIDDAVVFYLFVDLAIHSLKPERFDDLMTHCYWPNLQENPEILKKIAALLKQLDTLEWHSQAAQLLERLTGGQSPDCL